MDIRTERPDDVAAIRILTRAAFEHAPHSSRTEAAIVDALRAAGVLTLSLVAIDEGERIGHAAFSPVTIAGVADGWFGLGPLSVRPDRQRRGIGRALVRAGLAALRSRGAPTGANPGEYNAGTPAQAGVQESPGRALDARLRGVTKDEARVHVRALGCVVLGDPAYYGALGFESDPELTYGDVPPGYFRRIVFGDALAKGDVAYHPAFEAS